MRVMKELRQQEHDGAYVSVGLRVCVCSYLFGCGADEGRCEQCWSRGRRQGRLCLEIPAFMCQHYGCVGQNKNKTDHAVCVLSDSAGPLLLLCLPLKPAYCNPPCLAPGTDYGSARPTWTPGGHSIPSIDRAYWLLCQRPYYINPSLDWQRFSSVCSGLCVQPTDDI